MISNICLSCGDDLDWPSGDGCANMTAHKNDNKPWEMLVVDVVDHEDGGTTVTFDLDKEAYKEMANIGIQFVLHCAAAKVDMQVALDAILKMGESNE